MPPRALTLPDRVAAQVGAGSPVIETADLPNLRGEPGQPLLLLDGRGETLATAIADPENDVLRIVSRESVPSINREFFATRVRAAFRLRQSLGLVTPDAAYRLLNTEGDGLGGFAADVFGAFAVLYVYSRGLLAFGRVLADAIVEVAGIRGVVVKVRPRQARPGKVHQVIVGESPPETLIVREGDFRYEVHLLGGLNVGLFTDMREHRRGLRRFTRGKRVLNTFAYTGSLSVVAALAGASEVVSVDLSSGVLKWACENFRLAGLDPDDSRYRFEARDVMRFLGTELERKAQYDVIILDPPTFSAARASSWSMKNDYPDLIALAASLLPDGEGGILWVSANTLRSRNLLGQIQAGMDRCGRECRVLETGGLPPDYPTPVNFPQARNLEVYLLGVI